MSGASTTSLATHDSRVHRVPRFDVRRCKQCGLCAHMCPAGVLKPQVRTAPTLPEPEACTGCRTCEYICPDFAVRMAERVG
ncbi:MAG: 4Fe-4S dicluster domain-containing protein [Thermoleophilia bacterium]